MSEVPQPKKYNTRQYCTNYSDIEWRNKGDYCFNCGKTFKKDEMREYYDDGHAHCKGYCNYN